MEGRTSDPRAALREIRRETAPAIELDPGLNVLLTREVDDRSARDIAAACRSSRAVWTGVDATGGETPRVARVTRSEIELRGARLERARAQRATPPEPDTRGSQQHIDALEAQIEALEAQIESLQPELGDVRARLAHESDLRDRIAVACDLVEFAIIDDAEGSTPIDNDAYARLALEWELFEATRASSVAHNREAISMARRALDAASARHAMSGAIGTIDSQTMDKIQRLHQRHQEAAQALETSRRNQRQERTRELEEAAAEERAALHEAGLDSYSDFLMLRVRSPKHEHTDDRLHDVVAAAERALHEATDFARAALAQHEADEIDLRARAATLLGRLPGADVGADLREAQAAAHAAPQVETPSALVELAALCRQADLDLGPDPVETARTWLRKPSRHTLELARLEAQTADLDRARRDAVAELEARRVPEPSAPTTGEGGVEGGVESVAGAIRGLLTRGALVPNTTRSVDIDPPIVGGLRDALAALDRDERADAPVVVEYPWEGEADAIVGRMLGVLRDASSTRQLIVVAAQRYARPVADVHWIDVAPVEADTPASEAERTRRWASSLG